ncbi:uncharacterized protein SPSK_09983 [Sporothrix schenckii 1099-18]|uniref:Uncharacterized protein n=1 Tax=Sporothrix schenckii 1099-18 TaxID=1397361 RepID=A0A0F2M7J3_SPOSC|nr:uncharacterized protein SPSK_09983 [Sporothrix schenckii 1099-18]KJR85607.1 hypothetical protein SPSK_09983 [Sporothrix schenckii 1099-18]
MPEDAPYDPYIPSGEAAPAQGAGGGSRTQALQACVVTCGSNMCGNTIDPGHNLGRTIHTTRSPKPVRIRVAVDEVACWDWLFEAFRTTRVRGLGCTVGVHGMSRRASEMLMPGDPMHPR